MTLAINTNQSTPDLSVQSGFNNSQSEDALDPQNNNFALTLGNIQETQSFKNTSKLAERSSVKETRNKPEAKQSINKNSKSDDTKTTAKKVQADSPQPSEREDEQSQVESKIPDSKENDSPEPTQAVDTNTNTAPVPPEASSLIALLLNNQQTTLPVESQTDLSSDAIPVAVTVDPAAAQTTQANLTTKTPVTTQVVDTQSVDESLVEVALPTFDETLNAQKTVETLPEAVQLVASNEEKPVELKLTETQLAVQPRVEGNTQQSGIPIPSQMELLEKNPQFNQVLAQTLSLNTQATGHTTSLMAMAKNGPQGEQFDDLLGKLSDELGVQAIKKSDSDAPDFILGAADTDSSNALFQMSALSVDSKAPVIGGVGGTTQSTNPIAASLNNQVVDGTKLSIQSGRKEISIQLNPNNLGQLRINLTSGQDQRIHARLIADKADTCDLLENQISSLRNAMESQGIQVDKISVILAGSNQMDTATKDSDNGNQQQQTPFQNLNQQQASQQYSQSFQGEGSAPGQESSRQYRAGSQTAQSNEPEVVAVDSNRSGQSNPQGRVSLLI